MKASFSPVPVNAKRPTWSVMIPVYNSAVFLRKTLECVLAQDPGPDHMQIEVVDDASDIDPTAIVNGIGKGRVSIFRQASNQGQIGNLSTCIERAQGEIVHLLHGDDFVLPGFYSALEKGFRNEKIGAAFCRWMIVDVNDKPLTVSECEQSKRGPLRDALERLASEQRIVTPSIAVRRRVWEQLGGFNPRLRCAEDWEMWVRIAAHHAIWYEPNVLAAYRRHDASTTARNTRNAEELRYSKMAIDMFAPLLPAATARQIVRRARRAYASTAVTQAAHFWRDNDLAGAWANVVMAARLDPSIRTLKSAVRALMNKADAK